MLGKLIEKLKKPTEQKKQTSGEKKQPVSKLKKTSGKALENKYFAEATAWDNNIYTKIKQSERRAWIVAVSAILVALLASVSIASMLPLKTVEPFVIRVDNNTGLTDVVNILRESDIEATEAMNKYWLSQYIRHRENYLWDTRNFDRRIVGLMSAPSVQEQFATYTDPRLNQQAPIRIYGENTEVKTAITAISMLNNGETIGGETRYTALVRYSKDVSRAGEFSPKSYWAATITFTFRNTPMNVDDRLLNPLGFQVLNYRNDQESAGGQS